MVVILVIVKVGVCGNGFAIFVIDHRIGNVVVILILLGCLKVSVGIDIALHILGIPVIGVESVLTCFLVIMILVAANALYDLMNIVIMNVLVQLHLIDQTDGCLSAGSGDAVQIAVITLAIQLDLIGQGGDQRSGDCPCQGHVTGRDFLTDTDSGIHHICLLDTVIRICFAQEGIGLIDMGSIARSICFDALVPETDEIAFGIGVPADIVAELLRIGIGDLAMIISLADQRLGSGRTLNTQTCLDRADKFIAHFRRIVYGTEATILQLMRKGCTGVEVVSNDHALDIGDFHVLADMVDEGNIAVQIQQAGGHQRGGVTRLKNDLIHDLSKGIDQRLSQRHALRRLCLEEIIYIVLLNSDIGLCNLRRLFLSSIISNRLLPFNLHCLAAGKRIVGAPIPVVSICCGIVHILAGVQNMGRNRLFGVGHVIHTQTQSVEHCLTAIVLRNLCLGISSCQLSYKSNCVVCIAAAAITHMRCLGLHVAGGSGSGSAVTHKNQNGHTGSTCLDLAIFHNGVCGKQRIHSLIKTVLNIGAALDLLALGFRTIHSSFNTHFVIDGDFGCAAGGIIQIDLLIIFNLSGGISAQRQEHCRSRSAGITGRAVAGIQNDTNPVVVVDILQSLDRGVGCTHHIIITTVIFHGAGNVQNQHGIRRNGGITGDGLIGCHCGQRHQEIVTLTGIKIDGCGTAGIQILQACQFPRKGRKDRLVRPDHTCILGRQFFQVEELLPAGMGRLVRHAGLRIHRPCGDRSHRHRRQQHYHCQQK